jgi:hypothetical protein
MASPITVTANLQDPSGTALTGNSFVRFKLRNFQGFVPVISGTSVICETIIDALPTAGAISQSLWGNNNITPSTTWWTVEFWDQGRITSSGNYIINGNTNLNTASQLNTPPVPTPPAWLLENNGALNSSQTVLNLKSTDSSVTITDLGAGNLNLQASNGVTVGGAFVGPWLTSPTIQASYTTAVAGNNYLSAFMFMLPVSMSISKITADVYSGLDSLNTVFTSFGIYSAGGALLLDSGAFGNETANGTLQTKTITRVNLPAGMYYLAVASTSNHVDTLTAQSSTYFSYAWNGLSGLIRVGQNVASGYTGTTMPSTLPALTSATSLVPPCPLFEY